MIRLPQVGQLREMDPMPMGVGFVVVMAVAVFLSFNLHRLPLFGGTTYTAAFSEAAGLHQGDSVRVAGVKVGQVTDVLLDGAQVLVKFRVDRGGLRLGDETTATIEIGTLLGNKYLALDPGGAGRWDPSTVLPLTRTQAPYDVIPAFQDLSNTAAQLDSRQLAQAFDTIAATFRDTSPDLRTMLDGMSRLAQTVASRDVQLRALLQHAATLTGVLADRRPEFARILGDGSDLLRMVRDRRAVIDQLLQNTADLAAQLTGVTRDNQQTVGPMLARLEGVVGVLDTNQDNLDETIRRLYVFVRGEVDATGAGPWFDGTAINATNPFHVGSAPPPIGSTPPRTFGQLLRIPGSGG